MWLRFVVSATQYKTCYYSICQKWLTSGFVNKCLLTTEIAKTFFFGIISGIFFFYFWIAATTNINRIIGWIFFNNGECMWHKKIWESNTNSQWRSGK